MGITPECRLPSFIIITAPKKSKTGPNETQVQTFVDEKEASVQLDGWKTDFSMPYQEYRKEEKRKLHGKNDKRYQNFVAQGDMRSTI